MQRIPLALIAVTTVGCATAVEDEPQAWSSLLSVPNGKFAGSYHVPTDDRLAMAARFPVTQLNWSVIHEEGQDIATLRYKLPEGLVGGRVIVDFRGPAPAGATDVTLTGAAGVAVCSASEQEITCHEQLSGLGSLPISTAVVERAAAAEYLGPVGDRVAVALLFGSDPIGIATIDLGKPILDPY